MSVNAGHCIALKTGCPSSSWVRGTIRHTLTIFAASNAVLAVSEGQSDCPRGRCCHSAPMPMAATARLTEMPRRPTPDPLSQAKAFADEAEQARDPAWRRSLLINAREQLERAQQGLDDAEQALLGFRSPVVEHMRTGVEKRRLEIKRIRAQVR